MAEGLIPACLGLPGPKSGIFIPWGSLASCLPCGSLRQWPVLAAPPHKPAIGMPPRVSRLRSSGVSGAWALRAGCRLAVARWPRHCAPDR